MLEEDRTIDGERVGDKLCMREKERQKEEKERLRDEKEKVRVRTKKRERTNSSITSCRILY